MRSTFVIINGSLMFGITGVCIWAGVAYARAFWATRRRLYLLLGLAWLSWPWVFTIIYLLKQQPLTGRQTNPLDAMNDFALMMPGMSMLLAWVFNQRPSASLFEFRSPRNIMLFRPTIAPSAQQEGLLAPTVRPQRPRPAAIVAVTIVMFGAIWALLALIVWLIRWLV